MRLGCAVAALVVIGLVRGRLSPHEVPDTPSYVDYDFSSAVAIAEQIRTPVYPLVCQISAALTGNAAAGFWLVGLQLGLHAAAVAALVGELMAGGIRQRGAWAAGTILLVANTFWDHGNTLATDAPAMSLGLILGTLLLRLWRTGGGWRCLVGLAVVATLLIFLRPAYLFVLPWLAVAIILPPLGSPLRGRRVGAFFATFVPPVMLLLMWCSFRSFTVDDFGLLPFGHQNMAAVTTQLLDEDELAALPDISGEIGRLIAAERSRVAANLDPQVADGLDLRSAADPRQRADSFTTIENRWDAMTYLVVVPAAGRFGESTSSQHQVLAKLDRDIVSAYPTRYLRWVLLAFRRGIWGGVADLVMHPVHLTLLLLATMWWWAMGMGWVRPGRRVAWSLSLRGLVMIAASYAVMKIGFVSLTSPPIGRFADAAMVWWPAVIVVLVVSSYDHVMNASSDPAAERN